MSGDLKRSPGIEYSPGKFAFGKWYEMLLKYIIPAAILVVLFVGLYAQIVG